MRCKNCGWENPDGQTTCEKCHGSLGDATPTQQSRICTTCGSLIGESSLNCLTCHPELHTTLIIEGLITPVSIKARLNNNALVLVWWWVISMLSVGIFYLCQLIDHQMLSVNALLRITSLLCSSLMWIGGYCLVTAWEPIGKYSMCGAIYFLTFLASWNAYSIISDFSFPMKGLWYEYIEPTLECLMAWIVYIGSLVGFYYALQTIKKGDNTDPQIWKYNKSMVIPIFLEFVLPLILIIVSIVSRH